ncbi:hypothetical protein AMATHDRAFT_45911 [Amanita thiersii Skay4041]|uniref:Methanethiol oxidase n=1 Tax=Amanita thiersii Skay4041 TaxID=703135 RepID=A0A2A9NR43_9AGAR|nr:hypothetical protein AMATHDRAFT_45911 [Amanita thiersii Skay4041]
MKSSLISAVLLSLFLTPFSIAAPPSNGTDGPDTDRRNSVGAAFTMTNQESGNHLVVLSISKTGQLSFDRAIPTGGRGARGMLAPIGDSIFSQGSMQIHYGQEMLVHTNPGSSTLSVWHVDPKNPLNIRRIGQPVPSGGDFPNSVTFNKAGDRLCALNTGTRNGFMCFMVDKEKGLTPLPATFRPTNINQTIPATGPQNSVGHIKFSPNEDQLYVTYKGFDQINTSGFLARWNIDLDCPNSIAIAEANDQIFTDTVGLRPFGMTLIPGRNAVLTADPITGFDIFDLDKHTSKSTHIPNQGAHCWSMYSQKTGNYYLADADGASLTEISIDTKAENLTGVIEARYPKIPGSFLADPDLVDIKDKQYIMTLAPGALSIYVDELRGPKDAHQIQRFDLSVVNRRANIPIDKNHTNGFITYLSDSVRTTSPCPL